MALEYEMYRIDIVVFNTYEYDNGETFDDGEYWDSNDPNKLVLHPYERLFVNKERAIEYAKHFTKGDAAWALSHGNGIDHESVACVVQKLIHDPDDDDVVYQEPIFENVWKFGTNHEHKDLCNQFMDVHC